MVWQLVFALGLGFSNSESVSLPFVAYSYICTATLRWYYDGCPPGFPGNGRCRCHPCCCALHCLSCFRQARFLSTSYSSVYWLTPSLPRARDPWRLLRLPLVPLSAALLVRYLVGFSPNLASKVFFPSSPHYLICVVQGSLACTVFLICGFIGIMCTGWSSIV